MRYYIDIGTYDGELLEKAISYFEPFDSYIGFEPVPALYAEAVERFRDNPKVVIFNLAVSDCDKNGAKFYICYCKEKGGCKGDGTEIGTGSTLLKDKIRGNIDRSKFIRVNVIDFSQYIIDNYEKTDEIFLKIDIEGEEYKLLHHMIETGAIRYVDKIFCEWHYHKMKGYRKNKKKFKKSHYKMVSRLNELGFDLKGNNVDDELDYIIRETEDK